MAAAMATVEAATSAVTVAGGTATVVAATRWAAATETAVADGGGSKRWAAAAAIAAAEEGQSAAWVVLAMSSAAVTATSAAAGFRRRCRCNARRLSRSVRSTEGRDRTGRLAGAHSTPTPGSSSTRPEIRRRAKAMATGRATGRRLAMAMDRQRAPISPEATAVWCRGSGMADGGRRRVRTVGGRQR